MEGGDETSRQQRRNQVCQGCRIRHARCDWDGENCRQCLSIGLECVRSAAFKFRQDPRQRQLANACGIKWRQIQAPLTFHDETLELRQYYYEEGSADQQLLQDPLESTTVSRPGLDGPEPAGGSVLQFSSPSDLTSPYAIGAPPAQTLSTPLTEPEAVLIRNYVEHMALWTDAHDPTRTFELELPRLALTEAMLRHAICAFSARHLYRGLDQGETEAIFHQDQCLQLLIPAMSDSQGINESTLMAVAILRQNEEMDGMSD